MFVNTMDKFGDEATMDMIIERTITEYCDNTATQIGQYAFYECTALTKVDVPNVSRIDAAAFARCSALVTVILRNDTVIPLPTLNVFLNTPIASGTGYVYVPRALLSDDDVTKDYRRATNWANHADKIRALEDYTIDGTITGELDETKI